MRFHAAFLFIALLTLCLACHSAQAEPQPSTMELVASYGGGKLFMSGPVYVLELHGSYREMGCQYGFLMRKEMQRLYSIAIETQYIGNMGYTEARVKEIAQSMFALYPQRYKEIIYGMARTSRLGLDKQIILNAIEFIPKMPKSVAHCSGIAVWGEYTSGGPLIFGRNNDDTNFFRAFAPYTTVVVYNANDGSLPVALVNYAGAIYPPSGMNKAGIFLELNSGNAMGYYANRLSIFISLFSFLQDFRTMDAISSGFYSIRPNLSSIVNAANTHGAFSFECPPDLEAKRRVPDKDGLLAATNHFVDPSWGIPPPDDKDNAWTVTRRAHLLEQGEKYKGQFTVPIMKRVLEMTIDEGGATDPTDTIYQIIAVPRDLTMWIRAPDNYTWQEVNLRRLFD
ncbi:MAG: C45 family peptidase [Acidobacteriota bacterium]